MSAPVDRVLAALRGHGAEPKPAGRGWCCRCPAHDDRNPSLSLCAGDDGRALLNCHAGCPVDAICDALGLSISDLFDAEGSGRPRPAPRSRPSGRAARTTASRAPEAGAGLFPTANAAVKDLERRHGARSHLWTYHNAKGEPVGLVVRWDADDVKCIRPVSRGEDGWRIGGMPLPRPLYALPDLLAAAPDTVVFVTEGEKAANAARAVGLTATTSPHGAESAGKADWSPLSGREVVIFPDHDAAGEKYAAAVARMAMEAGARRVRVVRLADLWDAMPEGGDMADLLEHRAGDLERIRAELLELVAKALPEAQTLRAPAMAEYQAFPVDCLPDPIGRFVAEGAKAMGCDASYIALPLLSALAAAIGNTHRIALKREWTEPAIVWTAIVGDSGTAKSPALELGVRPIRKRQHDAMKEHAEAMKQYANTLAMHEREAAHWKKSKSDAPPPAKPEAPIADRCWTDDVTTEALAVLLQQNPRGLLMVRDELAGWFNFDRYAGGKGGGDAAKWLEMFGGRPMVVDRKTGGTLYVPRAAVSIAGAIQPATLRRALGQEHRDNGLAARLLLTCPPRKPKRWTEADVNAATEAAVAMVFDRLFGLTPEADDDGDVRPRLVTLADDGKRAWVMFYDEHAGEQVNLSGDEAAAWSKLEGYAARLALVVHLTRWAAGDATLGDSERVDAASIGAGVRLARWFGDEARRVYAILGETDELRESRRLVEWIDRKGGTATVRDLTRGPREYRGDPERAAKALGDLVAAGVGRWEVDDHDGGRGRPADRFRLLSRRGDTGDGDVNRVVAGDGGNSVAVATVATATDAGDGWGEL